MRQLADYQSHMEEFKKENIDVVALSVDPLDKAKETVEKLQLAFPVVYGLEVPRDADKVGAFWEERRKIIHATISSWIRTERFVMLLTASVLSAASLPPTP